MGKKGHKDKDGRPCSPGRIGLDEFADPQASAASKQERLSIEEAMREIHVEDPEGNQSFVARTINEHGQVGIVTGQLQRRGTFDTGAPSGVREAPSTAGAYHDLQRHGENTDRKRTADGRGSPARPAVRSHESYNAKYESKYGQQATREPAGVSKAEYNVAIQQLQKTEDELSRRSSQFESSYQKQQDYISNLERQNHRLAFQNQSQQKLVQDLENQVATLAHLIEDQEKHVVSAQSAAKTMMEQNRSFATSDSDIVQWFANRSSAWYGWAKDTAPGNKQQCFNRPEEEIQELMAQLKTFMVLAADGKTPAELDREKKLPYILLHGMLANFICAEIFANPFSILDSVPGLSASSNTGSAFKESKDVDRNAKQAAQSDLAVTSKVVDSLYGYLVDLQEKEAHQWRSQLMRLLATNGMSEAEDRVGLNLAGISAVRRKRAVQLSQKFLSSAARFMIRDSSDPGHQQFLVDEFDRALQFSAKLWSQRSVVQCLDLQALRERGSGSFPRISDSLMDLHQSQRPEPALLGKPLLMVLQPAIVACGTEEGRKYDQVSRIWLKARVWVGRGGSA